MEVSHSRTIGASINLQFRNDKKDECTSPKSRSMYNGPDALDKTMEAFEIDASKCDSHTNEPALTVEVSSSFSSCAEINDIDMPTQIDDKESSVLRDDTISGGADIEMIDPKNHAKVNTRRKLTKGIGPSKKKVIRPVASRRSDSSILPSSHTTTMELDADRKDTVLNGIHLVIIFDHIKTA